MYMCTYLSVCVGDANETDEAELLMAVKSIGDTRHMMVTKQPLMHTIVTVGVVYYPDVKGDWSGNGGRSRGRGGETEVR